MKQELITLAQQLGFDLCRVAACTSPPHAAEFRAWIADGRAGEMAWMERNQERRTDPQLVLPGAKSVIVLAMSYWNSGAKTSTVGSSVQPDEQDSVAAPATKIARYAWGDDYHDVIEKKLRELDAWLSTRGGVQKCYVDTGPVLERDFAALAGVGWHGKSTMLISPELGAWFFLAEILTTLDLEPDSPLPDRCGKCTRCMVACPTGAITGPQKLDARRCVSYLTIELKGSIPEELRPLIGDRIYGCDDCAAACPWNRFAKESREATFSAREFVHGWSLRDFLTLDDEQFRTLFRKSPIKRVKRRGFLRNVCVALGNVGTPEDLPALERAAHDAEPLIAEHAVWAINQIRERNGEGVSITLSREGS
ncbi:tRNA epoxyqueuosine(34) reductase QueG [Verrucomicrobiota bacterium sgz303538]